MKASVWDEVNGLDEKFAVAFNDVDFCLRVRTGAIASRGRPMPS
ncbi:MAG: glycosyltransferase family 2 protein [Faecalibacterium prausnitzii]